MIADGHSYSDVTRVYPVRTVFMFAAVARERDKMEKLETFRIALSAARGDEKTVKSTEKAYS